jgi:peptidoglycan/xylan/chitin deacetylase (PgdA/CDA1 family)
MNAGNFCAASFAAPAAGGPPVSVLMYHQVGPFVRRSGHKSVMCSIDRFRAQMAWLHAGPYHVISLDHAYRGLFGTEMLPTYPVVLTFDDGYQNFADCAWPVLERYGFPATVFAVTGQLGSVADWLDESFAPAPLMDAHCLRTLARQGVSVGSHSCSHLRLSALSTPALQRELHDSKARLEDLLGHAVVDFCYPYGDYDARVRDLTAQAGYRLALTCLRGAANTAGNAFEIPRKAISFGDNWIGFAWKLHRKHARKAVAMRSLACAEGAAATRV